MFFIFSKILWWVFSPFQLIFLLILAGWCLLFKKPLAGRKLIGCGLIFLMLFGLPFVPDLLMRRLEERVARLPIPEKLEGIIVLAGMVDMKAARDGDVELRAEADRIISGIIVAKNRPQAKLMIMGSNGELGRDERLVEADYLKRLVLSLGIDSKRLIIERKSRNTHEHAAAAAKLLSKDKEWLLITSAFHMPRSFGCFKKEGLSVIPYPVDYKTKAEIFRRWSLVSLLPSLGNLNKFGIAFHEWLGLIFYRLAGYTETLFPYFSDHENTLS